MPLLRLAPISASGRAAIVLLGALALMSVPAQADRPAHAAVPSAPSKPAAPGSNPASDLSSGALWDAQDGLVKAGLDALQPRVAGQPNVYGVAIAASGRQQLFSREAHLALQVAATRFGAAYRGGLLLSNGAPDILHVPLVTRGNVLTALDGLAHRTAPSDDVAFVYLASHGAPDASLETDLPNLQDIRAISAKSLGEALAMSGIRRRIIVISACFSGSWIPALANDDTILITAARYDRTSFGCDDRRRLTYFGEAFLEGPLAKGASLEEAFVAAQRTVADWERKQRFLPSEPQVYVGRNMQALWTVRGSPPPRTALQH